MHVHARTTPLLREILLNSNPCSKYQPTRLTYITIKKNSFLSRRSRDFRHMHMHCKRDTRAGGKTGVERTRVQYAHPINSYLSFVRCK